MPLILHMTEKLYPAKTIIFREGDPGDAAYIIQSGKVEILKRAEHGDVSLATLGAGQVFGEIALFVPDGTRSATAHTLEETRVHELSAAEFAQQLAQCPPPIVPFLQSMIERLKSLNVRVASKERATVLLDVDINTIQIEGDGALAGKIQPVTVHSANLPFSIGGYAPHEDTGKQMLNLPCDSEPQAISPHHCNLELQEKAVYVVDQGSLFRTIVNGKEIGRGRPIFKAPLLKGENSITLGGFKSPFKLKLVCS